MTVTESVAPSERSPSRLFDAPRRSAKAQTPIIAAGYIACVPTKIASAAPTENMSKLSMSKPKSVSMRTIYSAKRIIVAENLLQNYSCYGFYGYLIIRHYTNDHCRLQRNCCDLRH
ncbi:MAG: hypothetical protein AAGJ87_01695 [Pseudomonadota bacterium]